MEKYSKNYMVRSYEVDKDGYLRLLNIFNIFQDISDLHAQKIGVGYDFCEENHLAWVGANYRVKINHLPKWRDEITLQTWPSGSTAATAYRDSCGKDKDGRVLFMATSQWALLDTTRMRPVALAKHINVSDWLTDRMIDTDFPALKLPERIDFEKTFYVRFDDIDINNHVNNSIYPVWASESVPVEFRQSHRLKEVAITFKRPALYGDEILVSTEIDDSITRHILKKKADNTVCAVAELEWI